jgi:hypothetical protein
LGRFKIEDRQVGADCIACRPFAVQKGQRLLAILYIADAALMLALSQRLRASTTSAGLSSTRRNWGNCFIA